VPDDGRRGAPAAAPASAGTIIDPIPVAEPPAALVRDARKLVALLGAVVAPATLVTALAYYFGWRRERAFAGYFGIDSSVLGFSNSDYVLRSVDALFVPFAVVLLVVFAVLCLHVLVADRVARFDVAPLAAAAGLGAIAIGIALAVGHPIAASHGYLQALGPGVGAILVAYSVNRWRPRAGGAAGAAYVGIAIALVSAFWATAEYADTRGRSEAERLARNLGVDPQVSVFSRSNLNIDTGEGSAAANGCPALKLTKARRGAYPYRYDGFVLLLRSNGKLFLTPEPAFDVWDAKFDPIFVLPDDGSIRIQLKRGGAYPAKQLEGTTHPFQPLFTC
jgi:hypothetical protein